MGVGRFEPMRGAEEEGGMRNSTRGGGRKRKAGSGISTRAESGRGIREVEVVGRNLVASGTTRKHNLVLAGKSHARQSAGEAGNSADENDLK